MLISRAVTLLVLSIAAAPLAAAPIAAGPLDPPAGPIAPTQKTLASIEPRVAMNAANTPGDANSVFRITQPGSYYLTGNITGVSAKHALEIASGNVSLDLCGFTIAGVPGSLSGIATDGAYNNLAVRNGVVTGCGLDGVNLAEGGFGFNHVAEGLTCSSNAGMGMRVGGNAVVRACTALQNGNVGIDVFINGAVSDCLSRDNASVGISIGGGGSSLSRCTARGNVSNGFVTGGSCTVTGCAAFVNAGNGLFSNGATAIVACSFQGNTGHGVVTTGSTLVCDCTAASNSGDGIRVTNGCVVRNNVCTGNGLSTADGAGINVGGTDTRVEGNNCIDNDRGVDVDVAGNIIVRNTCSGNGINWSIVTGNVFFAVNAVLTAGPVNGVVGGSPPGSTDPNVNFSY